MLTLLMAIGFMSTQIHAKEAGPCTGLKDVIKPHPHTGLFAIPYFKDDEGTHCFSIQTLTKDEKNSKTLIQQYDLGSKETQRFLSKTTINNNPHVQFNLKALASDRSIGKALSTSGGFKLVFGAQCETGMYTQNTYVIAVDEKKACSVLRAKQEKANALSPVVECSMNMTETKGHVQINHQYQWDLVEVNIISNRKKTHALTPDALLKKRISKTAMGDTFLNLERLYSEFPALSDGASFGIIWMDHMDQGVDYCVFGQNKSTLKKRSKPLLKHFYPKTMRYEFEAYE